MVSSRRHTWVILAQSGPIAFCPDPSLRGCLKQSFGPSGPSAGTHTGDAGKMRKPWVTEGFEVEGSTWEMPCPLPNVFGLPLLDLGLDHLLLLVLRAEIVSGHIPLNSGNRNRHEVKTQITRKQREPIFGFRNPDSNVKGLFQNIPVETLIALNEHKRPVKFPQKNIAHNISTT